MACSHTHYSKLHRSPGPEYRTHLWVVGAQLINGTELDQFLVDAEKGAEESMSRLFWSHILVGTGTSGSANDDRDEASRWDARLLLTSAPHSPQRGCSWGQDEAVRTRSECYV